MNPEFMQKALDIARLSDKDMPVGAVVVRAGVVIGCAHNEKESNNDVSAHAEILAIKAASKIVDNWRLNDCDLYVTLEPCPMCLWAIMQARIKNVYFGAYDVLAGGFSTLPQMIDVANSKLNYKGGIMEEECKKLLADYFADMRN